MTALEPSSGLPVAAIREQLDRILSSPDFHATDKLRDFLRFVVEEKLAGRADRLNGYSIAVSVFGRPDDFDAANDPIVRIQAGRLRRALERYYLVVSNREAILIDIPKGRYIPRFSILPGKPDMPGDAAVRKSASRSASRASPSVVVTPVKNLTGNADELPLATGLTEEIVTELTRFQDITVFSCHAALQPTNFPADCIEIANRVGARFALECTVRQDVETVKVSAHLVDTTRGTQVWAEAFTHPLDASQLIATQEQIARSVVAAVASEYGIIARRLSSESRKKAPAELRTYEAMLRYYNHQISPTPESAETCFAALQAAAEREPGFAPLWSALATLYCQMHTFDVPGFDQPLATALEYARKGVSLDPGAQLGHLILAYASHLADDIGSFHEESATALALNPNSVYTVGAVGYLHTYRGEMDIGLPLLDRAISRNPCHPAWFHGGHVIDRLLNNDYEQALAETRMHHPFVSFWDDVMLAAILGRLDRADEAQAHVTAVREAKPDFPGHPRALMLKSLKIPELVDELVDGLQRVGLAK